MAPSSTEILRGRLSLRDEMADGDLGDARLNARRDVLVKALQDAPAAGFPEACACDGDTEALYRFLRNRRVSLGTILEPHFHATRARCRALDEVLILHDTTEVSFPGRSQRSGLTKLGTDRQGFWVHASLAVSAEGFRAPLGLLSVKPFSRANDTRPHVTWRERFHDPKKESRRWAEGIAAIRQDLGGSVRPIHVMDREGDSYELFAAVAVAGDRAVVRLHYDREVRITGANESVRLSDVRARLAIQAERTVTVAPRRPENRAQRLAFPARDGREAAVSFAACAVEIQCPKDHRGSALPRTVALNVVFAWESQPPVGEVPVEWWLITTEPIETRDHILQIVEWYRSRWLIEEFFKCLKTGCAYEQRQLESYGTLLIAFALLAPIAWQLLLMRHLARELSHVDATAVLAARQIAVLRATAVGHALPPQPTIRDALLVVARLGGHLRQNGEPGWLVLARGMQKLRYLEAGWAAAKAHL
jgi:Transposase DNA-binding/Transposase DDE domain